MKKLRVIVPVLVIALAMFSTASANNRTFIAKLSGSQEVPANSSVAHGHALFFVSRDGTELRYKLFVGQIQNVTQAHIHVGMPGVNGPVVLFLYPSAPPAQLIPGPFNGPLNMGTATAANLTGPLAGQPMSVLVDLLISGGAYVNVHTSQFPPGEIRGPVQ